MQSLDLLGLQSDRRIAPTEADIRMMAFSFREFTNFLNKGKRLPEIAKPEAPLDAVSFLRQLPVWGLCVKELSLLAREWRYSPTTGSTGLVSKSFGLRRRTMMGQLKHEQEQLFYAFRLDGVVPGDHLVREIAAVLDLTWVRAELASYYSPLGRPSIDPVPMIRMLIVGYVFAIRSERLLCREVQVNLAYRWFCGLSIEDKIPDHSAFSRARNERFRNSDLFRRVFERVVEACIAAGLVGGEGFAVDASLIVADANKQRSIPGSEWQKTRDPETASRAVKEYLATLDDAAFGAASEVTPKFVSPSDPAAQWTGAMRGPAFFAYADNISSM